MLRTRHADREQKGDNVPNSGPIPTPKHGGGQEESPVPDPGPSPTPTNGGCERGEARSQGCKRGEARSQSGTESHAKTRGAFSSSFKKKEKKEKKLQHLDFARPPGPHYYPGQHVLNFADRTGCGALTIVWP